MPLDHDASIMALDLPKAGQAHKGRALPISPAAIAADIQKPSAFVDKGSIVAFTAGVSGQNREDVLNSTLLSQLAADHKYDREKQVMDWYGFYQDVLGKIGWVVQGFNFETRKQSQQSFTMDEAVLEIAEAALTGQEELVVVAAIDAMRKLPKKDGRLQLFNHSAASDTEGNFQISVCSEKNGAVAMKTMAFTYDARQQNTDVLFFSYASSSTQLKTATVGQSLDSNVYAQVRQTAITKLGDNAKNFVLDLDIS